MPYLETPSDLRSESERPEPGDISCDMETLFCSFSRIVLLMCVSLSSQMGSSDLQGGRTATRVAWRCITGDSGGRSVTTAGRS